MTKILNHINTYQSEADYQNDNSKNFPNVSYIEEDDIVVFKEYRYDPDHIVCVYNVISTSEATKLINLVDGISYQIIDGVKQDTVQHTYIFDTLGEHTVKYKLSGTSVYGDIFNSIYQLTSVTIPDSFTYIAPTAFSYCTRITSVTIGNGVTDIGQSAFKNVGNKNNKATFIFIATNPPSLAYYVFTNNTTQAIYVPSESVDTYKTASGWSDYASLIQAM